MKRSKNVLDVICREGWILNEKQRTPTCCLRDSSTYNCLAKVANLAEKPTNLSLFGYPQCITGVPEEALLPYHPSSGEQHLAR